MKLNFIYKLVNSTGIVNFIISHLMYSHVVTYKLGRFITHDLYTVVYQYGLDNLTISGYLDKMKLNFI